MSMYIYSLFLGLSLMMTSSIAAYDACKTLTATSPPLSPPYSWQEDDKMVGAMPDTLHAIAQKLGITITVYYNGSWQRIQKNVALGHVDLLAGIHKSAKRMKLYTYTVGVFDTPVVVATHKRNATIYDGTRESLMKHKGIRPHGSSFGNEFDQYMKTHLSVQTMPPLASIIQQLIRNRADYLIADKTFIAESTYQMGVSDQIHINDIPLLIKPLHIVFSKKSECKHLIEPFNQVIKTLKEQGTLTRIEEKNRKTQLTKQQK